MNKLLLLTGSLVSLALGGVADHLVALLHGPESIPGGFVSANPTTAAGVIDVVAGQRLQLARELLAGTAKPDVSWQDDAVLFFIYGLRRAGAPGLQAVREYLRSGQDVGSQEGGWSICASGGLVEPPTRRLLILEALRKWPGPGVAEIDCEVLRQTSSLYEALLAVRNLAERHESADDARSVAVPAFAAVLERHAPDPKDDRELLGAFDVLRYYDAAELIPGIERQLESSKGNGGYVEYWTALKMLSPSAARDAAYERVLGRQHILDLIAQSPGELLNRDFAFAAFQAQMIQVFVHRWDGEQRKAFLGALAAPETCAQADSDSGYSDADNYSQMFDGAVKPRPELAKTDVGGLQRKGELAVLAALAADLTTPELHALARTARESIQHSLAARSSP